MTSDDERDPSADDHSEELTDRAALAARLAGIEHGGSLVVRKARKSWLCTCVDGRNYLPSCTGEPIRPGELHVEYLGEAAAYSSGTRYHAVCAIAAWSRPSTLRLDPGPLHRPGGLNR